MVQRSALPLSTGKNYKVVTLCGSTRFKEQYMEVQKRLTLEGCIVISIGLFGQKAMKRCGNPAQRKCSMTCICEKSTWQMRFMLLMSMVPFLQRHCCYIL